MNPALALLICLPVLPSATGPGSTRSLAGFKVPEAPASPVRTRRELSIPDAPPAPLVEAPLGDALLSGDPDPDSAVPGGATAPSGR